MSTDRFLLGSVHLVFWKVPVVRCGDFWNAVAAYQPIKDSILKMQSTRFSYLLTNYYEANVEIAPFKFGACTIVAL